MPEGRRSPAAPLSILLIAPDAAFRSLLRSFLPDGPDAAFRLAAEAGSLADGLSLIDAQPPDVILLGLSLPDAGGVETFSRVHRHAPDLPIIVLSRQIEEELALQTVHLGAQEYLIKESVSAPFLQRTLRYTIERARTEAALAHERDLLSTLLENIPDRIYFKDEASRFIRVNRAMVSLFGLSRPEDAYGKTDADFYGTEHAQEALADERRVMQTGKAIVGKVEKEVLATGRKSWSLTTKLPLRDHDGQIIGTCGISREITELKELEQRLDTERNHLKEAYAEAGRSKEEVLAAMTKLQSAHRQLRDVQLQLIEAEKMKTVGRLAAGVAHEVKNPLAVLRMGLEYLKGAAVRDENTEEILREMAEAVQRADKVIRGLLDFSAPTQLELQPANLNDVINDALRHVRTEFQGPFRVIRELQPDLPHVRVDAAKLGQTFVNLLTNAIHAMGPDGVIVVRTHSRQITGIGSNVSESGSASFRVGETIVVAEVEDNGPGIPEDKLGKIFEPFFTTKPTGKGTGLGLSVVKTIIDLHGGTIDLRNNPGSGLRATITLRS